MIILYIKNLGKSKKSIYSDHSLIEIINSVTENDENSIL